MKQSKIKLRINRWKRQYLRDEKGLVVKSFCWNQIVKEEIEKLQKMRYGSAQLVTTSNKQH